MYCDIGGGGLDFGDPLLPTATGSGFTRPDIEIPPPSIARSKIRISARTTSSKIVLSLMAGDPREIERGFANNGAVTLLRARRTFDSPNFAKLELTGPGEIPRASPAIGGDVIDKGRDSYRCGPTPCPIRNLPEMAQAF